MNNFKRLQEEEINRMPDQSDSQRSVRNRVEGMRTIGQVVELYLTKILDVFVVMKMRLQVVLPLDKKFFKANFYT